MDATLTGTTTPDQSGPGSNDDEGVFHIPQDPDLELHHQIEFNVIPRTLRHSATTF